MNYKFKQERHNMNMFLASWSDIDTIERQEYIDYEALIESDEEWLIMDSLFEEVGYNG